MSESPVAIPWGGEEGVCGMIPGSFLISDQNMWFSPSWILDIKTTFLGRKMIKRHTQIQTLLPEKPKPFPPSDQKGKNHTLSGRAEHN